MVYSHFVYICILSYLCIFCRVTICTANCKYEVVRQVALKLGIGDVGEDDSWNVYWTDLPITVEKVKEMKRFQVTVTLLCCHLCYFHLSSVSF
jgi:hypothetical protein